MTPKRVVERYLTEVLGGDHPPEELVSSAELRQRAGALRRAFPGLEIEIVALVGEDNLVAAHLVGRGTHLGVYQGVPPTGCSWEARCTAIYQVEEDRIADAWVTWDQLSLLEQLGAVERIQAVSA